MWTTLTVKKLQSDQVMAGQQHTEISLLERDSKGNILKLTAAADHLSEACSQVKPVNQSLTH